MIRHSMVWTGGSIVPWAAQFKTWLLMKLTPKGVVFSFHEIVWCGQVAAVVGKPQSS